MFLMALLAIMVRTLHKSIESKHAGVAVGMIVLLFLASMSKYYLWWGYFFVFGYLGTLSKVTYSKVVQGF